MAGRTYDNFDILIEAIEAGRYRARVTNCSSGDTPAMSFSLPFSGLELENLLLKLNPGRAGTRRILDPHAQASADFGAGLFDAVFRGEILLAWIRSSDYARERQHGVRLRLRLADAPELAGLPWEFLYDRKKRRFFAQSDRTPVVRYLDVSDPPRPLTVRGPLHILVVIASPYDLPPLDVEHEWGGIHDVLAEKERLGLVVVHRLPYPSLAELQKWLRRHEVHVLHFVGHGDFDARSGEGLLAFCDPQGHSTAVTAIQLGAHVRDHDPLRLVVLNACRTATTDNLDAFSGMAQGLIQQEAAAVVAMQFPISDGAAIAFTTDFYGAIADGQPVDQAMASARKALLFDFGEEWATPVLFLRAADGQVFDQIQAQTPVALAPVAEDSSTTTPEQSPPSSAPHRRRRPAIAIGAVLATGAVVVTFAIARHRGTSAAGAGNGPGGRTSSHPPPTSPASSPIGQAYPLINKRAQSWSGPAGSGVYHPRETLAARSPVRLYCTLYGQSVNNNRLWYWTDHAWINDYFINTGQTTPVRNQCTGNADSPIEGNQRPSMTTGPFALIGGQVVTLRDGPSNSAAAIGELAIDTLVTIACYQDGDTVDAKSNSGGIGGKVWAHLTTDAWIPNAYLLDEISSAAVRPCVASSTPSPSPTPSPTPTS